MTVEVVIAPLRLVQREHVASVGLDRDEKHRYYFNGVGPLVSVTTAIGAKDKPALVGWAKRETAACAVRNIAMLTEMVRTGGPEPAIAWLKGIPDYQRNAAADLGTRVHSLAERIGRGESPEMTDQERPFIASYQQFLADHQPEYVYLEEMVANLEHQYAGTFDAIARFMGRVWLLDIKTGKDAYSDTALQFAAYRNAEFIGRAGTTDMVPMPAVDQCAVLHLRPDGYRVIPYDVTEEDFRAFLAACELHRWNATRSRVVMGQDVPVPPLTLDFGTPA